MGWSACSIHQVLDPVAPSSLRCSQARRRASIRASASAAAPTCVSTPTRTIVSELEDDIDFCVVYGQSNSPTNGTWVRDIVVYMGHVPGLEIGTEHDHDDTERGIANPLGYGDQP